MYFVNRIRSLKITLSLSVAPMYLLFKDHKGWSLDTGTPPPSRPVVSAGSGQNDHMSEIISDLLEPVVKTWTGGLEKESSGDVMALIDEINEENIEIEEVDLESIDQAMEEQERRADEVYDNFDDQLVKENCENLDEQEVEEAVPEGWKLGEASVPQGWKPDGSKPVYGDLRLQFTANRVLAGGTGKYQDRLCGPVPPV